MIPQAAILRSTRVRLRELRARFGSSIVYLAVTAMLEHGGSMWWLQSHVTRPSFTHTSGPLAPCRFESCNPTHPSWVAETRIFEPGDRLNLNLSNGSVRDTAGQLNDAPCGGVPKPLSSRITMPTREG
jgi:hypothetical protein